MSACARGLLAAACAKRRSAIVASARWRSAVAAMAVAFAGFISVAAHAATPATAPAKSADGKPFIGGVWLVDKPLSELKTVDGKAPPLKPEAAAILAQRKQARHKQASTAGKNADDPVAQCLPDGVPRLLNAPQPIYIFQKPKQVTVMYQANHQARLVYLDEPVPTGDDAPDPTYNGTSVGHWQGNTLVVETVGFNDKTWLDNSGLPHSNELSVTERYELASPERLRVTITLTDPKTFTAPWQMQLNYKRQPGARMKEDPCAEKLWNPPSASKG